MSAPLIAQCDVGIPACNLYVAVFDRSPPLGHPGRTGGNAYITSLRFLDPAAARDGILSIETKPAIRSLDSPIKAVE